MASPQSKAPLLRYASCALPPPLPPTWSASRAERLGRLPATINVPNRNRGSFSEAPDILRNNAMHRQTPYPEPLRMQGEERTTESLFTFLLEHFF